MKTAVLSILFCRYPLEPMFRAVSRIGFDGLDLYGGRPVAYTYDMDQVRISEVLRLAEKYGLELPMYTPELLAYPYNIPSSDRVERKATLEYLLHSLSTAAKLHIPRMQITCGHAGYDTTRKDNFAHIYEVLGPLVEQAEKLGVTLILEPLTVMESNTVVFADDVEEILKMIDSPNLKTMMDTVTPIVNRESYAHHFDRLKGQIDYIHFVDSNGVNEGHLLLGTGVLDLPSLANQIKTSGYDGWLCIEIIGRYIRQPETYAEGELRKLKQLFQLS